MTATFREARDDMLDVMDVAWLPLGHPLVFAGLRSNNSTAQRGTKPTTAVPWARIAITHASGGQATLANHDSVRRYRRNGFITVQVFADFELVDDLAKTVADAYEGVTTGHGVEFRNVRVNDVGQDDLWYQVNVVIDFTYDEVK